MHHERMCRLALHVITFSNPRAVATLWSRFVRELRFSHWEPGILLPRMTGRVVGCRFPEQDHRHCSKSRFVQTKIPCTSQPLLDCVWKIFTCMWCSPFLEEVLYFWMGYCIDGKNLEAPPEPDLRHGLLHQKLQMLNYCIALRKQHNRQSSRLSKVCNGHCEAAMEHPYEEWSAWYRYDQKSAELTCNAIIACIIHMYLSSTR